MKNYLIVHLLIPVLVLGATQQGFVKGNFIIPESTTTAVDDEGKLDKNSTSYNDIFDAFRLSLQLYQFT